MKMRNFATTPAHEKLRDEYLAAIKRHAATMPAEEILAVTSVFLGQLIAVQDQRRFTPDAVMTLVSQNIELGNRNAIVDLLGKTAGHG
jgi:hypothetical protein